VTKMDEWRTNILELDFLQPFYEADDIDDIGCSIPRYVAQTCSVTDK